MGINLDNMHKAQLFAKTALYKGNLVALKPININGKIEITTELLIEIKKVYEIFNYQPSIYDNCLLKNDI